MSKIHPNNVYSSGRAGIHEQQCKPCPTILTVWKKSLVLSCNGFTVYDSNGNLAFRVDNYGSKPPREVVLMDAAGKPLITMRRMRALCIRNQWQGFYGEPEDSKDQRPVFSVRRPLPFWEKNATVNMFLSSSKTSDFHIEGSFSKRSCTVYSRSGSIVAEVKRKRAKSDVMLGDDVFSLKVQPGYDQALVMGFIVVLDQIIA